MSKGGQDTEKVFEWLQKWRFSPIKAASKGKGGFSVKRGLRQPDLLVPTLLERTGEGQSGYLAIECKHGDKHQDILDGIDSVINQALDYALGAQYYIDSKKVKNKEMIGFVLATPYSKDGVLLKMDSQFQEVRIRGGWSVRPMVFTQARILWRLALNTEKSIRSILSIGAKGRLEAEGLQSFPLVGVIIEKEGDIIAMLNSHGTGSGWHPWALRPPQ